MVKTSINPNGLIWWFEMSKLAFDTWTPQITVKLTILKHMQFIIQLPSCFFIVLVSGLPAVCFVVHYYVFPKFRSSLVPVAISYVFWKCRVLLSVEIVSFITSCSISRIVRFSAILLD